MGLREKQRQRTRHELEQAALDLFATKGFQETTVEDIAAAADIAPRTVYRHFPAKEDIIFASAEEDFVELLAAVRANWPGDGTLDIAAVMRSMARLYEPKRDQLELRGRLILSEPALHRRYLSVVHSSRMALAEAIAEDRGLHRRDLGCQVQACAVIHILNIAMGTWLQSGPSVRLEDVTIEALRCLHEGFRFDSP